VARIRGDGICEFDSAKDGLVLGSEEAIQAVYDEAEWDETPPDRCVNFVFHTYVGFLTFVIQREHRLSLPPNLAREALWRLHRVNLTWGLLAYGALFIPLLSYFNYLAQKSYIRAQEKRLELLEPGSCDVGLRAVVAERSYPLREIWNAIRGECETDTDLLRDIYVRDADRDAWQSALDGLRSGGYDMIYSCNDEIADLPTDVCDLFDPSLQKCDQVLFVRFAGMQANSHSFLPHTIDFVIDPKEVARRGQLVELLKFVRCLADATGNDAILTAEGDPDAIIYRVSPAGSRTE